MSSEVLSLEGLPQHFADYTFDDVYRVPLMQKAPTIDGFVDPEEWKVAAGFDGFSHEAKLEDRRSIAYVGATRTHFYVAIMTELPTEGSIAANQKSNTANLIWDDSLEVWICPDPGASKNVNYQMLANSIGYAAYQTHMLGDVPRDQWYGWEGHYKIAHGFHDGFWHCEIEIPIESIVKGRQITEGKWAINLTRNWKQPWAFSCMGNRSYQIQEDILFEFVEDGAAAIQVKNATDVTTRSVNATLSMHNPGTKPLELSAHLFLKRNLMPEIQEDEVFTIAPGETAELRLKDSDPVSNKFALFAMVRDKATGDIQYVRHYAWGAPRDPRWETVEREVFPVDFNFAYYPYYNKMKVRADISDLPEDAKLDYIDFVIRPKESDEVVASIRMQASEFAGTTHEMEFEVPALSGLYTISAEPKGEGWPADVVAKPFERHTYEWEHLGLGTSREVYAPFTPIKVDGKTLHTVLKEYDLNSLGLLDAVRTTDQQGIASKDVLAGPMNYFARVNGKDAPVEAAEVKITSAADDVLIAESTAKIGSVELATKSTLDYDGLLRVDLTISSKDAASLDSLDLEIPLKGEFADILHAMSDGVRYPVVTAKLPDGQGVVWSASELMSVDFPKNFCSYIFIGDPRRGLCWFTENDQGWSWDREKPNLDVVRKADGTVSVIVHLVNKPVAIDSPRTITFGMQGAPVKPMLDGWRHKWYTKNYSILGCDRHWFALGICGSVFPANKDMHLWEMIKRANTERLSDSEVDEFVKYGRKHFEPYGWDNHLEEWELIAPKNMRNRFGTTMIFYYDRSSSPVYDEWHTFADEWGMDEFNYRAGRAPHEIRITPSDSYLDYALYWYGKSFDVAGNTGVYVDNNYFCATNNTEMTAAYKTEDGSVMPSTGIWGLRELAKRTFIYMNERGMLPINMNHMSTTQVLPINAFYTVQYDWEWKFSEGDVHDRFSREYLLGVSNGEHAGVWPIMLHDNGKRKFEDWCVRTQHAVCTVNELIIDRYFWHMEPLPEGDTYENMLHYKLRMPICDIVQEPDCVAYRYWDDRPQPIRASDPAVQTVQYVRAGKEAILAATNYAEGDTEVTFEVDNSVAGFTGGFKVVDMETGEQIAVDGNKFSFPIKKHDLRQFRLTAG